LYNDCRTHLIGSVAFKIVLSAADSQLEFVLLPFPICSKPTSRVESYVTTDGQSTSLSWNKAPIQGLWPGLYYRQTVAGLLMWGVLSDERTDVSFTIVAGPHQRSNSRVRVPWDSWPYFTVSNSRLPQLRGSGPRIYNPQELGGPVIPPGTGLLSSPSTTRRATLKAFEPASTRGRLVLQVKSKSKLCYDQRSVGQSLFVLSTNLGLTTRFLLLSVSCVIVDEGRFLWRETGLPFTVAAGLRQRSHSSVRVPPDSRPYFTASFGSKSILVKVTLRLAVPPISLSWRQAPWNLRPEIFFPPTEPLRY
jgi:hypothetical protein